MKNTTDFQRWLLQESKTYSILCGEKFTHKEVLIGNIVVLAMVAVAVIAGGSLG